VRSRPLGRRTQRLKYGGKGSRDTVQNEGNSLCCLTVSTGHASHQSRQEKKKENKKSRNSRGETEKKGCKEEKASARTRHIVSADYEAQRERDKGNECSDFLQKEAKHTRVTFPFPADGQQCREEKAEGFMRAHVIEAVLRKSESRERGQGGGDECTGARRGKSRRDAKGEKREKRGGEVKPESNNKNSEGKRAGQEKAMGRNVTGGGSKNCTWE